MYNTGSPAQHSAMTWRSGVGGGGEALERRGTHICMIMTDPH